MLQSKCKSAIEDNRPTKKSHRYSDSYLDFEFSFILQNGWEKPQCVICSINESMLPNKFKCHLKTSHLQFVDKLRGFFAQKLNDLKRQVSTISKFMQLSSKALLASYQVVHRIFKCKKPHTIAKELILPAAVDLVSTIIGGAEKLKMVLLSDDTLCCQIGDMAENIHDQLIDKMKH